MENGHTKLPKGIVKLLERFQNAKTVNDWKMEARAAMKNQTFVIESLPVLRQLEEQELGRSQNYTQQRTHMQNRPLMQNSPSAQPNMPIQPYQQRIQHQNQMNQTYTMNLYSPYKSNAPTLKDCFDFEMGKTPINQ